MPQAREIRIHLDCEEQEKVREAIERRCEHLAESFPESMRFEVSLLAEGEGFTAHAHVSGRKTNLAVTHDWAREPGHAANQVLDKLESRLRRHHDKMVDGSRRRGPGKGELGSADEP